MSTVRFCSECSSPISESSRDGFCPRCLIGLALDAAEETMIVPSTENNFPDSTGSVFGNYELLEEIGRGGMGVVCKARQRTLNRVVALKLILAGSRATEAEIKRFRTEATAAATLQHPNIVTIHDVGEHEGQHYFSMDYIEGKSLADVIRRTPLPVERAARYVKIVAEAIQHAHGRGILHRDLKPHNVLIDCKDEPRITDFGLARQIEVDSDLTVSGVALGTPSYMPPEQADVKRKGIGAWSDVYSLGAILYDGLTGRPPFRADTPADTLYQVVNDEPARPRLLNPKVPRDLETICLKCLAKPPGQRYPSAQDLADDLGRFLRGEPIRARPVGTLGRLWRWASRNPAMASKVGSASVMFLLLGVAAFLLSNSIQGMAAFAAEQLARVISADTAKLADAVAASSRKASLSRLIQLGETNALNTFLGAENQSINESGLKWMGTNAFESWSLYNPSGILLTRWPEAEVSLENLHVDDRDHFRGAKNHAPNPYIGMVFRSRTDKKLDKFSVSIAIMEGEWKQASTVGVLLATVTTSSTWTRKFQNNAKVVLVGRVDPSDKKSEPWAIMSHPAYAHGEEAIRFDRFPTNVQTWSSSWYFDPAASKHPLYWGPWIAARAPVEGTQFCVIVQTRAHVAYALATAALVTALAMMVFFGWRFVRRRASARKGRDESHQ